MMPISVETKKRKLIIYELKGEEPSVEIDWQAFLEYRKDPNRLFFIQLLSDNLGQLHQCFNDINANPLVFERCIDKDATSGVFIYEELFVLQLPTANDWVSSYHPKLTLICSNNAIISISENFFFTSLFSDNDGTQSYLYKQTDIASLLFLILDGLVDHSSDLTLQARLAVDELENNMLDDIGDNFERRLLDYKRSIAHFEIAIESKHRTLMALLSSENSVIDFTKIKEPLRDVIAHVQHSQRYVERIEDRLSELQSHITLILQSKTNQRLRILTILSAIYMPLTLIAAIYGMNFRIMPELSWHYGYPITLIIMLGLACGLLIYFARKGWFR